MLVDSHCHLNFPEFQEDFDQILDRAEKAGIGVMQTICTKITEFPQILDIAKRDKRIYCSVGVHPNEAENQPLTTSEELINFTNDPKVIGIGETGLDYYYERSNREIQKKSFIEHIKASRETQLPIIIHTRNADADTINIVKEEMKLGKFPGLIHCFTSTLNLAQEMLDLGLYISISGIITFKKANELQDIVKQLPLNRLLVETDAPYLAPTPHRGKRNEPAYTLHTAEFLAELMGVSFSEVEKVTTENFFKLFDKAKYENN